MKKDAKQTKNQRPIVNISNDLWSELKADDASIYKGGDRPYYIFNRDTGTYDII